MSDHGQGVIGAVASQGEGGKRGEATKRDEATLANLEDFLSKKPSFLLISIFTKGDQAYRLPAPTTQVQFLKASKVT